MLRLTWLVVFALVAASCSGDGDAERTTTPQTTAAAMTTLPPPETTSATTTTTTTFLLTRSSADNDDDMLRAVGSAANEAVDALALPPARQAAAIERVSQRYARALDLTPRDLNAAMQASAGGTFAAAEAAPVTQQTPGLKE